ncbi:molybdopterin molybdotransferase MoeA [Anaerovorax odorimutans]|uniref:Molybdopterin molybdenumtransferase n=1 Tax=Anaerovorax odorimutans TaxID=109327 RepID=A0ABT1RKE7_9FIRM|nr:molybdopterin molybdotransferase MoeA [Anaerovorax odorimutans]
MKLLKVDTVNEAREKLLAAARKKKKQIEFVNLNEALGRILASDLVSPEPIPSFRRSTVDGYAVKAVNTQGAGESIPVFLDVIERIEIGTPAIRMVQPGQCSYVPTGGMIPEGADAVVMVEYCEAFDEKSIAVYDAVSPGRNVVSIGEDIQEEALFLKKGTRLRPQEIGVLASAGVHTVPVYKPWKISIISTGDELVPADQKPMPGQIRDINTYVLEAMSIKYGFEVVSKQVLRDERSLLEEAVAEAMKSCDLVVASGGSSQGEKDHTADVLDQFAQPGVFTHGIALKPGKPTILGYDVISETILMGLPGHPAAAMIVFELMAVWLHRQLTHQPEPKYTTAAIQTNVASAPGRATCLLVELEDSEGGYIAKPIFGKSGLMTTLSRAHGYTMIDTNKEGLKEGEIVQVALL